jgi:hypothetical protein
MHCDRLQAAAICFLIPFLSELKISWAFAAAPLHFQASGWPLTAFGATISLATLTRILMNAALTATGDWLIAPFLAVATIGAAFMLATPDNLTAAIVGIAAGHITDTAQVQASLCYLWRIGDPASQKRALRLQAFSATFGYSSGALLGGALYEHGGFGACAILQLAILSTLSVLAAMLPVVHAAFQERCLRGSRPPSRPGAQAATADSPSSCAADGTGSAAIAEKPSGAPPTDTAADSDRTHTIRSTNSTWLLLPVSLVWLCDGLNICSYICEWSLFAIYFKDAFAWSSTLTGAAQMAGDLLAAAILALTTTRLWARLLVAQTSGARSIDKLLLQPPWNLVLFFLSYSVTFFMLAQPVFAVSVIGQVVMGTVYVFGKQAVQECYVVLSHESLRLFRQLEFVGSCSFNLWMSASSFVSVFAYERVSMTAPFYAVAVLTGLWALVVATCFGIRLRGRCSLSFVAAERELLLVLQTARQPIPAYRLGSVA